MSEIRYEFTNWNPREETWAVIRQANAIISEYMRGGYTLTLRQLYYQFVARGLLANTQRNYKRLGDILAKARMQGMVSWEAMEDRTRNVVTWKAHASAAAALRQMRRSFTLEKWKRQPTYVEVWVEKEALAGVFERICSELEVPFFACRGYVSLSEMWGAAQRIIDECDEAGRDAHILHFGDHDPSGVDMTRDIIDRLNTFNADVWVERMALNMDQVREHNPPPNPAKFTDSRAREYVAQYGRSSWELDALDPAMLAELVRRGVDEVRDMDLWEEAEQEESEAVEKIDALIEKLS